MLLAEAAILAQLDAIGGVLSVLGRVVVAALALVASEGDFNTHGFTSVYFALRRLKASGAGNRLILSPSVRIKTKKKPLRRGRVIIPHFERYVN